MNNLIEALFCDNPELPTKVYTYCNSIPEYAEAEREYEEALSLLRARLGYRDMERVEDCFLRYVSQTVHAYYLFGLGLRQEVLWALGRE